MTVNLLVINYSMHSENLVFSHQIDVVSALSKHFQRVTVFTSEYDGKFLGENVQVKVQIWEDGHAIKNAIRIVSTLARFLIRNRSTIVFSHMTDVHSALISPLTFFLRIRHVLWYAHAHDSVYLFWSSFFVSNIVSSTPGSCRLKLNRRKLRFINQGISLLDFPYQSRTPRKLNRIFNYGRLDESKNIHLFFDLLRAINENGGEFSIDVYGASSKGQTLEYLESLKLKSRHPDFQSTLNIHPQLNRKSVSAESEKYDLFLNLFTGSLDKTLVEATLLGLPVLTWNREYCKQFGTWSGHAVSESMKFIQDELTFIRTMREPELHLEILRRYNLAVELHGLEGWVNRLISVLSPDKK